MFSNTFIFYPLRYRLLLLVLFFFIVGNITCISQEKQIDSLISLIKNYSKEANYSLKDSSYVNLNVKLGAKYYYINTDSTLSLAKKTLNLSKEIKFNHGEIQSLNLYGQAYSSKGKHKKALKYFEQALQHKNINEHNILKLTIIHWTANQYNFTGDYAKVLDHYLKGIDIAIALKNDKQLDEIYQNIASLYANQGDYEQASEFYAKVLSINKNIGDEINTAMIYSNIGSLYSKMKNYDEGLDAINKAIPVLEKHQILDWLAFAFTVKGEIYLAQEKNKWSLHWYEQSKLIYDKIDDKLGESQMYFGLSKAYFNIENNSLATTYGLKGFAIADTLESVLLKKDGAEILYKIYDKKNNFSKALKYHKIYKKTSDSLLSEKNKISLSLLKVKSNYEQQKEFLVQEKNQALARKNNVIYASIGIFLILIVIILLILKNQIIHKKLNTELEQKNKLITKRESELKKLNSVKDKIFSLIGHDLRSPIGSLQGSLTLYTNKDITKSDFISFIPKLKSDVDHILFTLDNLLTWSFNQMNGIAPKSKTISLKKLAKNSEQLLSEIATKKSITIKNNLKEDTFIYANINQIDTVIRNLISNAIKFTPQNGLILIEAEEDDSFWKIMIKDNGVGMTQDVKDKIFIDNSNITTYGTNNEKGTGLGLSLCKEMVEMNKGKIWVESSIHNGSIFYFTIPKTKKEYKEKRLFKLNLPN